jgi:hypothetical protein
MEKGLKKVTATVLVLATLLFATLAVLSIWDNIQIEQIFRKSLFTLIVIFSASAIILFVFTNFFRPGRGDDSA